MSETVSAPTGKPVLLFIRLLIGYDRGIVNAYNLTVMSLDTLNLLVCAILKTL